ncbi:DUF4255 domain-containing protein [Crenobacter sp. SG2303]|uniref:DUF4255 domain-containing protein n=1 Tax=Crenobacter oryzisoli TaxID=3056844 RepID=A0ABT7XMY7_9NEIS|nr:DUF4255 domain-containing protein [Crenobacter sp. SG2303]MDN0075095.1 DUF4255 domain-containing protein [Crenobacter sp. SG2303]MDN0076297.1 DUF4255 domain-containing protein [Crenobacter sp. SG2303]
MSTALAIAGVTAVLRDLLNDGIINHNVSGVVGNTVTVSALPPDRVIPTNGVEGTQINLFLHQVTPNAAWRNEGLPSRDASGAQRLSNPPLALDLHYLISAYGAEDLHAEILLGYAMQLLHETPVLARDAIRTALSPSPAVGATLPPALRALADCGLADQFEQIRITPATMGSEEMSRLWTALQTHYRPTAAYQVSVVLIQSVLPTRMVLPVLSRGAVDPASGRERGVVVQPNLLPPFPIIQTVSALGGEPMARLDDVVSLNGFHLDGSAREVLLENDRLGITQVLPASNNSAAGLLQFAVPMARSADFPAGLYRVSARLVRSGEADPRQTNRLALVLVPQITGLPVDVARDGAGTARFTLKFTPHLRPGQTVSLILDQREVMPETFVAPTNSLDFVVADAPVGKHLARLRIDGLDSPIIDRSKSPPVFYNQRINIT